MKKGSKLWHDIPGFTRYQVTRTGRVRSKNYNHTGLTREMALSLDKDGYWQVTIFTDRKDRKLKKVHQLVALTFISNPLNKPQVNHKDSKRTNNKVRNLEWATISENAKHGFSQGYRKSPFVGLRFAGADNATSIPVVQYSLDGKKMKVFDCAADATRETGAVKICEVCKGKRSKSGGFKWAYA